MSEAFFAYVRGQTDCIPPGYAEPGMRAYRHLVYIGAAQMVEAYYPALRRELGEENWRLLIAAFVRQSAWQSPFYGDLIHEFEMFIQQQTASLA